VDRPVAPCRLCRHEVFLGAHRCTYCGVANPAPPQAQGRRAQAPGSQVFEPREARPSARAETKPGRKSGEVTRAKKTSAKTKTAPGPSAGRMADAKPVPEPAAVAAAEADDVAVPFGDEPFEPTNPLPRHGIRGRIAMLLMMLAGGFLLARGGVSLTIPDGTSAGLDLLMMGAGATLLGSGSQVKRYKKAGFYVPVGLLGLAGASTLAGLASSPPSTWLPSLLSLGIVLFFLDYFVSRRSLFLNERDPLDEVRVPPPFRVAKFVTAGTASGYTASQAARVNATIAMNNAIALSGSVAKARVERVRRVVREFNVTLADLETEREALYRAYVQHFLADGRLGPDERAELDRLADILILNRDTLDRILRGVGKSVYRWRARQALKDGMIDAAEAADLARIRAEMGVLEQEADTIRDELEEAKEAGAADGGEGPLSDDEKEELRRVAAHARVTLPEGDDPPRLLFHRLRLWERIDDEPLPVVSPVSADLHAGETCHAVREVHAFHLPESGDRLRTVGPLDAQVWTEEGTDTDRRVPKDATSIAKGKLHLTARRLVLWNPKGQDALNLDDVEKAAPYANGVELRMKSGVAIFLAFREDVEEFAMLLDRAVRALPPAAPEAAPAAEAPMVNAAEIAALQADIAAADAETPLVDDGTQTDRIVG
jgi:Chloroplast envelope transporter